MYLLATTTESAVWVSLRTAWQCVPDLGTASSRSGIEIETTRSNSKNPSYKITIILTTTKPQSKLLKALEDKETERQEQKMVSFQFFSSFVFGLTWVSLSNVQDQWWWVLIQKKSEKIRLAFIVFFYLCCSSLQVLHKLNLHGKKDNCCI